MIRFLLSLFLLLTWSAAFAQQHPKPSFRYDSVRAVRYDAQQVIYSHLELHQQDANCRLAKINIIPDSAYFRQHGSLPSDYYDSMLVTYSGLAGRDTFFKKYSSGRIIHEKKYAANGIDILEILNSEWLGNFFRRTDSTWRRPDGKVFLRVSYRVDNLLMGPRLDYTERKEYDSLGRITRSLLITQQRANYNPPVYYAYTQHEVTTRRKGPTHDTIWVDHFSDSAGTILSNTYIPCVTIVDSLGDTVREFTRVSAIINGVPGYFYIQNDTILYEYNPTLRRMIKRTHHLGQNRDIKVDTIWYSVTNKPIRVSLFEFNSLPPNPDVWGRICLLHYDAHDSLRIKEYYTASGKQDSQKIKLEQRHRWNYHGNGNLESIYLERPMYADTLIMLYDYWGSLVESNINYYQYSSKTILYPTPCPGTVLAEEPVGQFFGQLKLYPQPAGNQVMVELPSGFTGESLLTLRDLTGRLFLERNLPASAQAYQLDLSQVPAGLYLLQVQNKTTGRVLQSRMLK